MPLFTERLRPELMLEMRLPLRTQPLASGGHSWADSAQDRGDPEELVDTYVDEPTSICAPRPRREQASLVTLLDSEEVGNDMTTRWVPKSIGSVPPPYSLVVLEDGLDEETYIASPLGPRVNLRASKGRAVAYAALACVGLLALTELALFAAS